MMYAPMTIQAVARIIFPRLSRWLFVMTFSRPKMRRTGTRIVTTIAKPEKMAPATKKGGKIVECQPGTMPLAKSELTIECTEMTSGVASPASRP